jgi:phosphate:Na+ symporter
MSGTVILISLAGDVGFLLWGTHMVTTGILRGYGSDIRRCLSRSLSGRLRAFVVGLAVTAVLQSSTATGLMAASFAASGLIDLAPGLSVMLGANVGTTLVVQVLSFNLAIASPILILVGVTMFRRASGDTQREELGRAAIGLGLMLLALNLLVHSLAPLESAPLLPTIMQSIVDQPVLALLAAALYRTTYSFGVF